MTTRINTKPIENLLELKGKSALITGGAMGIGYGIALRLSEAGAAVTLADMNPTALEAAVKKLKALGRKAFGVRCDVSLESSVISGVAAASSAFEGLDILINNARIFPFKPVLQMDESFWKKVHDVNLKGVFLCSREAAKQMVKQNRGGRIINIASADAYHPSSVGLAHYDASKAGVTMFTRASH